MRINQVGIAAATAALLAFGQAGASEQAAPDAPAKTTGDDAKPRSPNDTQQHGSDLSSSTRLPEGTGSGGGETAAPIDRERSTASDGVSYPLPDQDPELQKLLSE